MKTWYSRLMKHSHSKNSNPGFLANLVPNEVKPVVDEYTGIYDAGLESRKEHYRSLVNHYYDLATDFYEFGWGQSFHFAPRRKGESFKASLLRHQRYLADQLGLKPGMEVCDLGCGVGGPTGNLVRYSGASFLGINNNAYQVERARHHTRDVESLCRFIECDYMRIPEDDNRFDAAIAIESMPHAPDKTDAFREVLRVLRPGGSFTGYDWCLTGKFDSGNETHRHIKHDIMVGNGLPDISPTWEVSQALQEAGFELVDAHDRAAESDPETPWYRALQGRDLSLASFPRTPVGRTLTNLILNVGEKVRLAPQGARAVSTLLNAGADALVAGGESGVFTPMFFFLARKPDSAGSE